MSTEPVIHATAAPIGAEVIYFDREWTVRTNDGRGVQLERERDGLPKDRVIVGHRALVILKTPEGQS